MEKSVLDAPCIYCGYNGPGYWQEGAHAEGCPVRDIGGRAERESAIVSTHRETHARIAELERRLAREEEARELLMSTLAEERARGAVARDRLMVASAWIDDRVAPWGYTDADAREFDRDRDHVVELARSALSDPSPAVTALLELAEAAGGAADYLREVKLSDAEEPETWIGNLVRTVDRWQEVSR